LFILGPFNGDQISIVTGINKIFYGILSILMVYSLALTANPNSKIFQNIFKFIGDISYSVYLLHPIIFWYMATLIKRQEMPYTFVILCSILTLFTSWAVFTILEKNMIKLGKKLTTY
jgi:peptidoglycan/LPS O-acetylase OafA/YrhL